MNMKHSYHLLLVTLLLLLPLSVKADDNLGAHSFVVWANGGISNYIGSTPGAKIGIGGGGAIGLGYEWRGTAFLLQTGLAGKYAQTGLRIDDATYTLYNQLDPQAVDGQFDYQYIQSNRRDQYTTIAMQIPLMVGAHINRFYFLVGPKLNLNVINSYKAEATYSAVGIYKEFFDPFVAMPNHGFFTDYNLSTSDRTSMKVNVAGSVELGAEIPLTSTAKKNGGENYFRIAFFADMNILDDRIKSDQPMLEYPQLYTSNADMTSGLKMVDYLSSTAATSPVRNLFAGVKLTFVLTSGVKYGCVMCESGYPTRRDRRRGSRLLFY